MKKFYFQIGPILISQASALSGGLLIGMPALYAYTGWLNNLTLRLSQQLEVSVKPCAVAPVFHAFTLHRGHPKYVKYRPGQLADVATRGPNHPTVDEQKTTFEISLLIAVESEGFELSTDHLAAAMRGMKLAGGGISSVDSDATTIKVRKHQKATDLISLVPFNAICLADASYLLEDAAALGLNKFDAMLHAFAAPNAHRELKENESPRPNWLPSEGNFLPICIGAIALETFKAPSERAGIRQADDATLDSPTHHAFAESVFSLIRAQTVASVRANMSADEGPSIFWQEFCSADESDQMFFGAQSVPFTNI